MSFIAELLRGQQIDDVLVDTEVVYVMLADGTQISIRGLVVVEPPQASKSFAKFAGYRDSTSRV